MGKLLLIIKLWECQKFFVSPTTDRVTTASTIARTKKIYTTKIVINYKNLELKNYFTFDNQFLLHVRPTNFEQALFSKKATYIRQSSVLAFFWLLCIFREMVRSKCYAKLRWGNPHTPLT